MCCAPVPCLLSLTCTSAALTHFVVCLCCVVQSFAKNFGLYGERIGSLHVVSNDSAQNETLISQINILIRNMYSNPPKHGAEIVALVLSNPELNAEWRQELKAMSGRIIAMRQLLVDNLKKLGT